MLMFHTPIHDDVQARLGGPFGGFLVYHPELHPNGPGPFYDSLLNDRPDILAFTKDVDHVDMPGHGGQVGIGLLSQGRFDGRVDGYYLIPLRLQIGGYLVAGPVGVGREAHNGNGPGAGEDRCNNIWILIVDYQADNILSMRSNKAFLGTAPIIWSITVPFLKNMTAGIDIMEYCMAIL